MCRFEVMELYSLGSRQLSYGVLASVLENGACTYLAYIPDISCTGPLLKNLLTDATKNSSVLCICWMWCWMRCPDVFSQRGRGRSHALSPLLLLHLTFTNGPQGSRKNTGRNKISRRALHAEVPSDRILYIGAIDFVTSTEFRLFYSSDTSVKYRWQNKKVLKDSQGRQAA